MEEEINFAEKLNESKWSINEFIYYINNENPYCYHPDAYGDMVKETKIHYFGRTYDLLFQTLEKKCAPFIVEGELDYAKDYYFSPRILLNWAQSNNTIILTGLKNYLNYNYWKQKKYWTLDEAIILITSSECPFPHEVYNTLENEETYDLAKKLADAIDLDSDNSLGCYMLGKLGNHPREYEISKSFVLGWAKGKRIKTIPKELLSLLDIDKKHYQMYETEFTTALAKAADYDEWIKLPSCTIKVAFTILLGFRRRTIWAKIEPYVYHFTVEYNNSKAKNYSKLKEYIHLSRVAGEIEIVKPSDTDDFLDSYIKPTFILKWAIDKGIDIPEDLLAASGKKSINNNPSSVPETKCREYLIENVLPYQRKLPIKPSNAGGKVSLCEEMVEKFSGLTKRGFLDRAYPQARDKCSNDNTLHESWLKKGRMGENE